MDPTTSDSEACFNAWAPDGSFWSAWAKPVAFLPRWDAWPGVTEPDAPSPAVPTAVTFGTDTAIIVDLPGADAVSMGVALAGHGFRPVPLFNGTSGRNEVIEVYPIVRALVAWARTMEARRLPPEAPPAFLLDSRRSEPPSPPGPGDYDNRWIVLPQDLPSGALLASRGIRFATVIRRGGLTIRTDLAHVLRRWQEHGIRTRVIDVGTNTATDYVDVPKPSLFRMAWYVAIALFGLRRSNVGGFGSTIPERGSGGGFA
jgi:hypothetical protein